MRSVRMQRVRTLLFVAFICGAIFKGKVVAQGIELTGSLLLNEEFRASFRVDAEGPSVWLKVGETRNSITLLEVAENGVWARVRIPGGESFLEFPRPEVIDPLTFLRMNTPSGVGSLSVQDRLEEEAQADRVELDLMVAYQLAKERKAKKRAARRDQ